MAGSQSFFVAQQQLPDAPKIVSACYSDYGTYFFIWYTFDRAMHQDLDGPNEFYYDVIANGAKIDHENLNGLSGDGASYRMFVGLPMPDISLELRYNGGDSRTRSADGFFSKPWGIDAFNSCPAALAAGWDKNGTSGVPIK